MHPYISLTDSDIREMLETVGVNSTDDLFKDIPESISLKSDLDLPKSKSELEVMKIITELANKNISASQMPCFLGGGVYDHYIPTIIHHITGRSEFYTSYTPYQPEISQGTLQYIFEYQTLISKLTGMDLANASLYDGGSAVAEAAIMAITMSKKDTILVSESVSPQTITVLKTYAHSRGYKVKTIPMKDMVTDYDKAKELIDDKVGTVIVQSPNFYGYIEDVKELAELTHETKKNYFIMATNPTSLAILKRPGELGVDVVVGEGQPLGISMAYGGPYLGFFAFNKAFLRKIPGRIVGQTTDLDGKRSWVLTLAAREQHIRREKATSNICSNQGLNVLAATVYMSTMGKEGMKEVATQATSKAHYLYDKLIATGKVKKLTDRPFFIEFAVGTDKSAKEISDKLLENNIIGGFDLRSGYSDQGNGIIVAVTEKRTKEEMDKFVKVLEEVL